MKKTLLFGKTLLAVLLLSSLNGLTVSAGVPDDNVSSMQGIKEKFGSSVFTVHAYQKSLPLKNGEKKAKKRRNADALRATELLARSRHWRASSTSASGAATAS